MQPSTPPGSQPRLKVIQRRRPWAVIVIGPDRSKLLHKIASIVSCRDHHFSSKSLVIRYKKSGAPYVKAPYFVSVSHSRLVMAIAFSQSPIGIDIETIRLPSHWEKIAERVLLDESQSALKQNQGRQGKARGIDSLASTFTRAWSRKEALVKVFGRGILWKPQARHLSQCIESQRQVHYAGQNLWLAVTFKRKFKRKSLSDRRSALQRGHRAHR